MGPRASRPGVRIVAIALATLLGAGVPPSRVSAAEPLARYTLTVSENPAAQSATIVYTGTITPIGGTISQLNLTLDIPATSCTPAPNCSIEAARVDWQLTNISSKVTITATRSGWSGGVVTLYPTFGGGGCTGACPVTLRMVRPTPGVRLLYSGPSPITTGSVVHFTIVGSYDASPIETLLQVSLPAGFAAPTNLSAGAVWDAGSRRVEGVVNADPAGSMTFDAQVTASIGTSLTVTARNFGYQVVQRSASIVVGTSTPPSASLERYAGATRYATAAAISRLTFPEQWGVAFVATGTNFPDALVAGPSAFAFGGPVLLVQQNKIPPEVIAELQRLKPGKIYVLGGPSVVSDAVKTALQPYSYLPVERLAGSDRYATGARVVTEAFEDYSGPVLIATGENFPDALAGGPAAASLVAPIVLSTKNGLPAASQQEIAGMSPTKFILLGGTGVLSSTLVTQLSSLYPGVPVERWAGADRYATSAVIAGKAFPAGADTVFLSVGNNYPDALAGGPAGGVAPGPILLSRSDCLPPSVYDRLQALNPSRIVLLGGATVLAASAVTTVCPA